MYYIYQITNTVNGKFYIGSAKNLTRRKATHLRRLKNKTHHSRYLQNAFDKYGESSFVFSVLDTVEDDKVYDIENQYIKDLKPDYNMMKDVFSHIGLKRSKETCEKISKALTGKKMSEETKQKVRQANIGKKQSPQLVAKRLRNNYKRIAAYDKKTGNLIKEYESATHAAKELGIKRALIYEVLNNYEKSHKGIIWKRI